MDWIALTNFLSRWILFFAVAYKAYQTKDKGWTLLATAFFITAFDVETYLIHSLGLKLLPGLRDVIEIVHVTIETVLIAWAVLHLKFQRTSFRHVVLFSVLVVLSYLWIFAISVGLFRRSFALEYSLPMLLYGGTLLYLSHVLWKYVLGNRLWDTLFPLGIAIVALLNLTYPFTRPIKWFADFAFFAAALGRLLAAVGAVTFVFYPVAGERKEPSGQTVIPRGAYLFPDGRTLEKEFPGFFTGDIIAVTRTGQEEASRKFSPGSIVFWMTKVKDGPVKEIPKIIAISPTKLGILQDLVTKELERGYQVIYMDALEYLKSEVGFRTALKFLLALKDMAIAKNGTLVLVADMSAFEEKERKILEREFFF